MNVLPFKKGEACAGLPFTLRSLTDGSFIGAYPTSGTWTISIGGFGPTTLGWNATASQVHDAIEALDASFLNKVIVVGGPFPFVGFTVTFDASLGDVDEIATADYFTGGLTPETVVDTTTEGALAQNEIQQLITTSETEPTSGTFTLMFMGETTAGIDCPPSPGAVEAALEQLSTIGSGHVSCDGAPIQIEFIEDMGNTDLPQISVDNTWLEGGTYGIENVQNGGVNKSDIQTLLIDYARPTVYLCRDGVESVSTNPLVCVGVVSWTLDLTAAELNCGVMGIAVLAEQIQAFTANPIITTTQEPANLADLSITQTTGIVKANDASGNAVAPAGTALLRATWTDTMAGYLSGAGGAVASSAEAVAIQNNTRCVRVVPPIVARPETGTQSYRIELLLYDNVGNMEAPDSAPTIDVVNQAGTTRNTNLDSTTMTLVSTGRYRSIYTVPAAHAIEELVVSFVVLEGSNTRIFANGILVVDTIAVDFTAADRTKLEAIHTKLPSRDYIAGSTAATGALVDNVVVGSYAANNSPADLILGDPTKKLATDSSGRVTVGSNADKGGYTLSQTFPTNFSSFAIDSNGKVTYANTAPPTAAAIVAELDANSTALEAIQLRTNLLPSTVPTIMETLAGIAEAVDAIDVTFSMSDEQIATLASSLLGVTVDGLAVSKILQVLLASAAGTTSRRPNELDLLGQDGTTVVVTMRFDPNVPGLITESVIT